MSNCPVCLVGIVEPIGYVELKEGPLEFKLGQFPPTKKETIPIAMCSRESCQHVSMGNFRNPLLRPRAEKSNAANLEDL
ncbi:hypothetical protein QFZ77_004560 [Paenibacillus sp. V4I3]|nr:hypothetical protein [Paenibacillus sp. V4I3]MDQ0888036.1 hypothetical protein [Paenibacillus sp. V4I9]